MKARHAAAGILLAGYGTVIFALDQPFEPWGAPKPFAKWAEPHQSEDPRPFWARLLLSLRWDFKEKLLTGEAEF